jgi:hypothetical protein
MARFANEEQVYEYLGGLFLELLDDEELSARYRSAGIVFQYRCHDPSAVITLKLRPDEPGQVDLGPTSLEPDVVMAMSADTLHEFYLGRVHASVALARREITATGAVTKALRLARMIKPVIPRYRARLERAGRLDLLT